MSDVVHDGAAGDTAAPETQAHAEGAGASGSGAATTSSGTASAPPPAETPATVGHQIVFIDGGVPEAQFLANGVQAGIEVVILDPNSNGVQQIADYLTSHNEQNLDAIQIVSHGEDGTVRLGNTILGQADISLFKDQLATIGQALKPGGDILFYGCNVGEGVAGALFEIKVSQATGGAHVAASSGLVGAAALGGSWTLDVADGPIEVGNPFTAETLAAYADVLTSQIWFTEHTTGGTATDQVGTINPSGTTNQTGNSTSIFNAAQNGSSNSFQGIALDAADGYWFAVSSPSDGPQQLLRGSVSGGAPTVMFTASKNKDQLWGVSYSSATGKVYFSVAEASATLTTGTDTGIYAISATGPTGLLQANVAKFIAPSSNNLTYPNGIAIDAADNLLFFSDFSTLGIPGAINSSLARIEVANLTTGAIINNALQTINTSASGALFWGLDVDAASNTLYWTKNDPGVAANNTIQKATYTIGGGGTSVTLGSVTTLYQGSSTTFMPFDITVDSTGGNYYAVFGSTSNSFSGQIVVGSLTSAGTPTNIFTVPGQVPSQPEYLELDNGPTVTAGTTVSYTEQSTAPVLASTLTVTDPDGPIASATVSISAGRVSGDTLNFTNQNGITGSYNSGTGVLTLTGIASSANYQTALSSITFSSNSDNPTNFGANTSRTISWAVSDGILTGTAAVPTTVNVTAVNDPPVLNAASGSLSYTENQAATAIDAVLTATDADSTNLTGATVSITANFVAGQDVLSFITGGGITGSYNSATGVLTLSGSSSVANYQQALRSVTYFNSSDTPSTATRTISYQADDGAAANHASNVVTATVTVAAVNDAPVLNAAGGSLSYTENQAATAIDAVLTATDADSANLTGATVSITANFATGQDVLGFTDQNGITGSYNASTGVLTLSGSSSVANYQTALRSVTYSNSSDNPSTATRTISYRVDDGAAANHASNIVTAAVTVAAVNDAPVLNAAGGSLSYTENQTATAIDAVLTATDADSANLTGATVSITANFAAGQDVLGFTTQNGITGSYNAATGVLTLGGSSSVANYQTALRSVTYFNSSVNPSGATRTISYQADDGSVANHASNVVTTTVTVAPVNGAPVLNAASGSLSYTENQAATAIDAVLTATDADSANLTGATVSITANFATGQDVLGFTDQNGITGSYDSATGVLTLSGSSSVANYQTALRSVTYSNSSDTPSTATRTISYQVDDGAAANHASNVVTATVTVAAVNDAPVLNAAGGSLSYTENQTATAIDAVLTATDADSANLTGATVSITANFAAGQDVLGFTTQNGITGSYDSATGVLTLSGSSSVANYQTALRSVTYFNSSDNPSGATRTISYQVDDGAAANHASNVVTAVVTVTPVNDAPVVTAGTTVSYTEQGTAPQIAATLSVTDADNANLASATVSISAGFVAGDTLNFTTQNGISGSYDGSTGVLTLSGSATVANYQTALRSITFSSTSDDPTNAGSNPSRTISWTANDGTADSTAASSTVNVTAVDDAPVVTAGTTVHLTQLGSAVVLDSTLTVSDADNPNLASATVSISAGFVAGDTLNFTNQNGITGSYDSGTGVLTLSGSATVANYQTALRSITFSSTSDNPTNFGANPSRTITWQVNDGAASSTAATSTAEISFGSVGSGQQLVGYTVSAGSALIVGSGGTATSTTILGGGLQVVAAGGVASAPTVLGRENINSGGLARGVTVSSGGVNVVSSGGVASGTVVLNGGTEVVAPGGSASGTIVSAGGTDFVYGTETALSVASDGFVYAVSGGTINGATVSAGGTLNASSGSMLSGTTVLGRQNLLGSAQATSIGSGGVGVVSAGGVASGTTVLSAGVAVVGVGGSASASTVSAGGVEYVYGTETGLTVASGGAVYVTSGGTVNGATVSAGGTLYGSSGSVLSNTTVFGRQNLFGSARTVSIGDGGVAVVSAGGVASATTVLSGGTDVVGIGGSASGTTVSNGGTEYVYGTETGLTVLSGGAVYVTSGGTVNGAAVSAGGTLYGSSGSVLSNTTVLGRQNLFGSALATSIGNGGVGVVSAGGVASSTTVLSGGTEVVGAGGSASGTTVSAGGTDFVYGTETGLTAASGGLVYVISGGAINGATVAAGGTINASSGSTISGTTVLGRQNVFGSALATSIGNGGVGVVSSGGAASGTTVLSGGTEVVGVGGTASATLVSGGGTEFVYGTENGLTVASGGNVYVISGGVISGATLSGGFMEIRSGGTVGTSQINFTSAGGYLELDDSQHFNGVISGFGVPGVIDLTDIHYSPTGMTLGYSSSTGILTVGDGTHTAQITLLGQYALANFTLHNDGSGGTAVFDPPITDQSSLFTPPHS